MERPSGKRRITTPKKLPMNGDTSNGNSQFKRAPTSCGLLPARRTTMYRTTSHATTGVITG